MRPWGTSAILITPSFLPAMAVMQTLLGVGGELDLGTRTEELRVQASERPDGNTAGLYSLWLCELEPLECPF